MIEAAYIAIASAAAAIGGVVGFGIQLRKLEKSRLEIEELQRKAARAALENEKLKFELQELAQKVELTRLNREKAELEVDKLRQQNAPKSPIITEVSTEEVLKFGDIRFSRRGVEDTSTVSTMKYEIRRTRRPSAYLVFVIVLILFGLLPPLLEHAKRAIDIILSLLR